MLLPNPRGSTGFGLAFAEVSALITHALHTSRTAHFTPCTLHALHTRPCPARRPLTSSGSAEATHADLGGSDMADLNLGVDALVAAGLADR